MPQNPMVESYRLHTNNQTNYNDLKKVEPLFSNQCTEGSNKPNLCSKKKLGPDSLRVKNSKCFWSEYYQFVLLILRVT